VSSKRIAWLLPAVALVGAQAGHVLAYQLRFGNASLQIQGAGAHAYFPSLAKTALGLTALAALVALFVIGAARVVGRRRLEPETAPSLLRLLAGLFSLQLAAFAAQETVEALLGGGHLSSAATLLLWGAVGQLPVALIGALALRWLGARVAPALAAIRLRFARPRQRFVLAFAPLAWPLATVAISGPERIAFNLTRRGPPSF
jgi:hypothetical protein